MKRYISLLLLVLIPLLSFCQRRKNPAKQLRKAPSTQPHILLSDTTDREFQIVPADTLASLLSIINTTINSEGDTITQPGHGFSFVGTMVGQEAGNGLYFAANSSGPDSFPVAFISEILDGNSCVIREEGWMDWTHGLPPGRDYFLQDNGSQDTIPDSTYQIFAYRTFGTDRAYFDVPELIVSSGGAGSGDSSDADWFSATTTTPPNDIGDAIFTNGNVGINTDNPSYPLEIVDDSGGVGLALIRDSKRRITLNDAGIAGVDPRIWIYDDSEALSIQLHPTATTYFKDVQVFLVGNTLLPATTDPYLFGVDGNIHMTGEIVDASGNAGTAGQVLIADGAGSNNWGNPLPIFSPTTITANTAYATGDDVVEMDASSNAVTYTLPASPTDGLMLRIKAIDITNTATVAGNGQLIDGNATYVFASQYESITLIYNLTDSRWSIY